MQKIIGLDIGSYSIKAVEIINKYKSYEISNFYENVVPQVDEISPNVILPTCMEQLFQENDLKADRIVTAMPGQYISSRILTFNFSDPRKIEAAVLAEIEDAVPFNLDEMIIDHQILGQYEDKTMTLVVMTKKVFLASFLEHLHRIGIDPKVVDVDSLAFYNLSPYILMKPGRCYGLVDAGHEKTSVCIVEDGMLRMFRSINLGGRYITEFLARDLEISFNEAQRIKHQVSQVLIEDDSGENLSRDERDIAERITIASNAIVKELGRTVYAFKTWDKSPISKIFLSGGTSTIKNFDKYLSNNLEIKTYYNRLDRSDLKIKSGLAKQMPSICQSMSIGVRAVTSVKRHSQINLRKGPFAYVQDYESVFKVAGIIFRIIAVALLLLSISYGVKYFFYSKQIEQLQELYKKQVVTHIPDLKKKVLSGRFDFRIIRRDAITELQDRIGRKHASTQGFLSLNADSGSLVVLREISKAVPKSVAINVVEYKYETKPDGSGKVQLRIETDSYDTLAQFEKALQKVEVLEDVKEKSSDAKPGSEIIVSVIEAHYINKILSE